MAFSILPFLCLFLSLNSNLAGGEQESKGPEQELQKEEEQELEYELERSDNGPEPLSLEEFKKEINNIIQVTYTVF